MKTVDVVINVYGKPLQTAVTLLSLMKFSGERINKIYFIEEPKQPRNTDFKFIRELLGDKLIAFTPKHWLWVDQTDFSRLSDADYRRSIRYQFAWEESTADYLYFTHNDVLYENDIVGALLDNIGDHVGIGDIGQCWNCPAFSADLCNSHKYFEYRPDFAELIAIHEKYPTRRNVDYKKFLDPDKPWTLPECRLNEWVALVNLKIAKPETAPFGDAAPFGAMVLDTGTEWFKQMSLKNYKFIHYDVARIAKHAWATGTADGHSALSDKNLYERSEAEAREKLLQSFNLDPMLLPNSKNGFSATNILLDGWDYLAQKSRKFKFLNK